MGNAKKCKYGSGRQPLFPELEEWVADRRSRAFIVCRAGVQAFAFAMAPHLDMGLPKLHKIEKECHAFNEDWTHKYFFSNSGIRQCIYCVMRQLTYTGNII